jgi:hypothetical protein
MPRRKLTLTLMAGSRTTDPEALAVFFEKVTGRKVSRAEIDAAKKRRAAAPTAVATRNAKAGGPRKAR